MCSMTCLYQVELTSALISYWRKNTKMQILYKQNSYMLQKKVPTATVTSAERDTTEGDSEGADEAGVDEENN